MTKTELEQKLKDANEQISELQKQMEYAVRKLKAFYLYYGNELRKCKKCGGFYRDGYICSCGWDTSYELPEEKE